LPVGFPPLPRYPDGIDDDYTLFLVYNTAEAQLVSNNPAWSEEIEIVPQPADKTELWADNGFANINGELFYYDAVEKDINDRVFKLKRCARNLGGEHTQWNPAGTWVRGFVIAEHHNQIVDTICRIEKFVGINFSALTPTLDYRIRNLRLIPIIFDDFGCPDVNFTFNIISEDPASGTDARFDIQINGDFTSFVLTFGDGTQTSSETSGTHHYAPNSTIDPVVTFTTPNCQIVQTPIIREISEQPQVPEEPRFDIPALPPFEAPPVIIFPFDLPLPDIQLPPLITPCVNTGIPSVVFFQPPNPIPSQVTVTGIPPSIAFVNVPSFPSTINIVPSEFPAIKLDTTGAKIPIDASTLSGAKIGIDTSALSGAMIGVDWSGAPTLSVQIVCPGETSCPTTSAISCSTAGYQYMPLVGGDPFAPPRTEELDVQYDVVGFPSEIRLLPPDNLRLTHDLPESIRLEVPVIPDINVIAPNIPSIIRVEGIKIPEKIELDAASLPKSIPVTGIPETIRIEHNIPDTITITLAEETKKIFEEGLPPVKLRFDTQALADDLENLQCVAIVPCKR
jgi:hypothetical protein